MLPKVKMINDMIAVRPDTIDNEVSEAGLHLVQNRKELPTEGEVIAVGPGMATLLGERIPMQVAVGDRVTFEPLSVSQIKSGDDLMYIMAEEQVLAILQVPKPSKRTTKAKK